MTRALNHSRLGRERLRNRIARRLRPFRGGITFLMIIGGAALAVWLSFWFPGGYPRTTPPGLAGWISLAPFVLAGAGVLISNRPAPHPVSFHGRLEWRRAWVWPVSLACWALALLAFEADNLSRLPMIWQVGDWPRVAVAAIAVALLLAVVIRGAIRGLRRPVILAIDRLAIRAPQDGVDRMTWRSVEALIVNSQANPPHVRLLLNPGADRSGLRDGWPDTDEIEITLNSAGASLSGFLAAMALIAPGVEIRPPQFSVAIPNAPANTYH